MEKVIEETTVNPVRAFVNRHKVAIAVVATAAVGVVVNRIAIRQHDEFLKEHDLYETFYNPEDE